MFCGVQCVCVCVAATWKNVSELFVSTTSYAHTVLGHLKGSNPSLPRTLCGKLHVFQTICTDIYLLIQFYPDQNLVTLTLSFITDSRCCFNIWSLVSSGQAGGGGVSSDISNSGTNNQLNLCWCLSADRRSTTLLCLCRIQSLVVDKRTEERMHKNISEAQTDFLTDVRVFGTEGESYN